MSDIRCVNLCRTFHQGDITVTGLDHVSIDIKRASLFVWLPHLAVAKPHFLMQSAALINPILARYGLPVSVSIIWESLL